MQSSPDLLTLSSGRLRLILTPAIGGSIAAFEWIDDDRPRPILRRAGTHGDVLDASSFPLVPYVNRIRDGRFHLPCRQPAHRVRLNSFPRPGLIVQ